MYLSHCPHYAIKIDLFISLFLSVNYTLLEDGDRYYLSTLVIVMQLKSGWVDLLKVEFLAGGIMKKKTWLLWRQEVWIQLCGYHLQVHRNWKQGHQVNLCSHFQRWAVADAFGTLHLFLLAPLWFQPLWQWTIPQSSETHLLLVAIFCFPGIWLRKEDTGRGRDFCPGAIINQGQWEAVGEIFQPLVFG